MLRNLLAAALLATIPAAALAQTAATRNLTLTSHRNEYPGVAGSAGYSACWSYVHHDGREYAVIGTTGGTAIYNVSNPWSIHRVGFISGPSSSWREMKSYRNWIYIVTEGTGAGQGVQIVRMTNPEAPVLAATYLGTFVRSHTVSVDTARALLICNGTRNAAGQQTGVRVLSLANPELPVEVGAWPGGVIQNDLYVHDSVPIGDRLFASSIYSGIQRILDFTNPAAISQIAEWSYFGAFTHNAWPDATGRYLYVTDETNGEPLKVFDIADPQNPNLSFTLTSNPRAIVHNAHVQGNELYLSNYTEGIRILDLTDPAHPAEFAWADSYPGASGGFFGVWEVCPYFPSGTVIASDMQTGLYVYRPVRDYGLIRVEVHDPTVPGPVGAEYCSVDEGGCCCAPLPCACGPGTGHHLMAMASGVKVHLATQGDSLTTAADGVVQFAPNPGTHTVLAKPFGYFPDSATVAVAVGSRDSVVLTITPRPRRDLSGVIRDAGTLAGLENAELNLLYTPLHIHTNAGGAFASLQLPEDVYAAEARAPGHIPARFTLHHRQFSDSTLDVALPATATWDKLEVASGWTTGGAGTGDNATTGQWVRVEPFGTGAAPPPPPARSRRERAARGYAPAMLDASKPGAVPFHEGHEEDGAAPGDVQPEFDRTPPPGQLCYVTGQGTTTDIGQADVDNGHTSLTSPTLNLAGMADPVIGFWRWFYASGGDDDYFVVRLSNNNGTSWVTVDTLRGSRAHWTEVAVHVADHLAPTATMRIRFIAADMNPGSIVEAGVDDVVTYDAANAPLVDVGSRPAATALQFRRVFPNPASGAVRFVLELPAAGGVAVEVLDLQGRRVRTVERGARDQGLHTLSWDGADDAGRAAPAGLYFLRAVTAAGETRARVVRVESR